VLQANASWGAERMTLRLGPWVHTVAIADLERYAKTGEISPALQPMARLLNPDLQAALNIKLKPQQGAKLLQDLLQSSSATATLAPETRQQLQALAFLAGQMRDVRIFEFLRAVPQETVTLDLSSLTLATQANLPYLQTQSIRSTLVRSLTVSNQPLPPLNPAAPGPFTVQQRSLSVTDNSRKRTLPVDLYWGSTTQGPLVVISPGLAANRRFLTYLARHLASYGFTVAALEHPGESSLALLAPLNPFSAAPPSTPLNPFVERPRDVSFVLDQLAQMNQQPGPLQGRLRTNQVTLIGHSLGGYTALALAGAEINLKDLRQICEQRGFIGQAPANWFQCLAAQAKGNRLRLRDARVVQAIAFNPLIANVFGSHGLSRIETPTLILAATEDTLTPGIQQLRGFNQLPTNTPKYLITAIGASHLSAGDPINIQSLDTSLVEQERTGKAVEPLQTLVRGVSLALIQQLSPAAQTYRPFLSGAYAQSLSTRELLLRLNTTLPSELSFLQRN
jgi:predicted dienelactone hydrolase